MDAAYPSCPISSIGQDFNPLSGDQLENAYPFYARARREEPVFYSQALKAWFVTSYRDVRTVMGDPQRFSARDSISSIVEICPEARAVLSTGVPRSPTAVSTDPPDHARRRKVLNAAFSGSRMRRLEPEIRAITQARIDAIAARGQADLLANIAYPISLQVIARQCDIGDDHLDDLKRWGRSFKDLISSAHSAQRQVELAHDMVDYQLFMREHVNRKRVAPGADITSALIAGAGDEPFSESELVSQMVTLFVAGHETTAHMVGNALALLLGPVNQWREVVADRSLIPQAVEESLRFDGPVPTFKRTATVDTELGGATIARGDTVVVVFASANRDGEQFRDPDVFDLHRANAGSHMTFGHGIHFCVGAPLARVEGRVILEALAASLPNLRLAPHQELRHIPQLMIHGYEALHVEWDPSVS